MSSFLPKPQNKVELLFLVSTVLGLLVLGFLNLRQAFGVQIQGGSAVNLSQILDSNFNLSIAGTVEGSRFKALTSSGAPFVISSTGLIANLNADLLDNQHGSYYLSWNNATDKPVILSSLDGVSNDLGNIDLIAGANIAITADDALNTVTISAPTGGANADTLDALDSAAFLRSDASDTFTSGTLGFGAGTTLDVSLAAMVLADSQIGWAKVSKTGSSLASLATRSAGSLSSGNLGAARLPTGGNWDISSDLSVESTTLFVGVTGGSYSGMVGVGTSAPEEALHAAGNLLVDKTGTSTGLADPYDSYEVNLRGSGWVAPGWMSPTTLETLAAHGGGRSSTQNVMGSDGFLRIVYYDDYTDVFKYVRCLNQSCTSKNTNTIDSSGTIAQSSIALGADGYVRIAYTGIVSAKFALKFARCTDADCSSPTISTVHADAGLDLGRMPSLVLDSSDNAFISYSDYTNRDLMFVRCTNNDCSAASTPKTVHSLNDTGHFSSIDLGSDGFARISFWRAQDWLYFAVCNDLDCSSPTVNTVVNSTKVGSWTSMEIAADGFGRIAYWDDNVDELKFAQCTNAGCTTSNINTVDDGGWSGFGLYMNTRGMRLGADGFGRIAYHDRTAGDGVLKYAQCLDAACSSVSISTVDSESGQDLGTYASLALTTDDRPFISYYSEFDLSIRVIGQQSGYAENRSVVITNVVTDATSYKLSVVNNDAAELFYIDETGNLAVTGDLVITGGDLTSAADTFNLLNTVVTTLNIGGAATALSLGAGTGTTTVNNALSVTGSFTIGGGTAISKHLSATSSQNLSAPGAVPGCVETSDISVSGAALGDTVVASMDAALPADYVINGYVSSAGNVKVRLCQLAGAGADPDGAGATYRVDVWQH